MLKATQYALNSSWNIGKVWINITGQNGIFFDFDLLDFHENMAFSREYNG